MCSRSFSIGTMLQRHLVTIFYVIAVSAVVVGLDFTGVRLASKSPNTPRNSKSRAPGAGVDRKPDSNIHPNAKPHNKTGFSKNRKTYLSSSSTTTTPPPPPPPAAAQIEGEKEPTQPRHSNEYRIKQLLLNEYDKSSRPVRNDHSTITVSIGMSLYHILDTNEKFQTLSSLIAVRLRWKDDYLTWNASHFGGVDRVWIPAPLIWTPDIYISNFADDSFKDCMDTNAIISDSGEVLWMFPAVVKTYCTLYVRHFPFDHQLCSLVFISWTFNGFKVNVTYNESENQAVYYTPRNQEWYVDRVTVVRNEMVYACCPEPYPDVTFTIHMTRRSLFYVVNLIFPCLLIYAVSILGFFLPVESGQKVNLEITILLALVVFLLIVGETLPPTPDSIPVLGILFGLTMIMVSISLVMSVIVTNIHLRKDTRQTLPVFLRPLVLPRPKRSRPKDGDVTKKKCSHSDNKSDDVKAGSLSFDSEDLTRFSLFIDPDFSRAFRGGSSDSKSGHVTAKSDRRTTFRPGWIGGVGGAGGDPVDVPGPVRKGDGLDSGESAAAAGESLSQAEEWVALAKYLDRLFFWLFVIASASSLTAIFISIPQGIDPDDPEFS